MSEMVETREIDTRAIFDRASALFVKRFPNGHGIPGRAKALDRCLRDAIREQLTKDAALAD